MINAQCLVEKSERCKSPKEIECVSNQSMVLAKWISTPDAIGYFLPPNDPEVVPKLSFYNGDDKIVTLRDISIFGLNNMGVSIGTVKFERNTYEYDVKISFRLDIIVDSYLVTDLDGSPVFFNNRRSKIFVPYIDVYFTLFITDVPRCDGTSHMKWTGRYKTVNGRVNFPNGKFECKCACKSSFINSLGEVLFKGFIDEANSLYGKIPTKVFYESFYQSDGS